jgi:hypothetical protein
MYNSETEILFPLRLASVLSDLRGDDWKLLTEQVSGGMATRSEKIAFVLMMIRLNGCIGCNADSYRAMRGCAACARLTIRRYRNSDHELLHLYEQAKNDAEIFIAKQTNDLIDRK